VIAPEVICTMGIIATRALLDLPQSLSQLRGRFHRYSVNGREISVMPTYHPSYLLQAEEMKKETWNDLQLIEKKLAG
jgi:uracil-DNA glycosylase